MKKNIIYIAALVMFTLSQISCSDDFLELEPKTGQVEANYYKTEKEAFLSVAGVYDALSVQNWQFVPIMADIFSDDAFTGGGNANDMGQWQELEKITGMTLDNSAAFDLWNRCYSGIYRANLYLEKQEGVDWVTTGLKERLEAEVKFLRAYFYWDLARHYGSVPIILEVLPSVDDYKNVTQHKPEEVYEQVATDLKAAIGVLPTTLASNEAGRVSKYTAQALMARVHLYYEGYVKGVLGISANLFTDEEVIDALDEIITEGPFYLLDNYADVFDWTNQNNMESLFEWQYSGKANSSDWEGGGWNINGNFSVLFYGPRNAKSKTETYPEAWSFCVPSWSLLNEFEAGDPRKEITIFDGESELIEYTKGFQNTGLFNRKYLGTKEFQHTGAGDWKHNWDKNYIDIRFAEVLLMAAELNLGKNDEKALGYLNQVRTRALGNQAALPSITKEDIMHERRVELAMEGHRKWDLLRHGLSYTNEKIAQSFNVPENIPNAGDFVDRGFVEAHKGLFPIPASEIRNTNKGTLSQYVY